MTYKGKYFQLESATLEPKPSQKPHPPVWIGGNSEAIRKVVGEVGNGWIPVLPTPKQLTDGVLQIKDAMKSVGRDPEKLQVAYGGSGCALIAENEKLIKKLAKPLIHSMRKPGRGITMSYWNPRTMHTKNRAISESWSTKNCSRLLRFPITKRFKALRKIGHSTL